MSKQTPTRTGTVLLTPTAVAKRMAVSRETVYREIGRGHMTAVMVGRQLRIDPTELDRYLAREISRTGRDQADG